MIAKTKKLAKKGHDILKNEREYNCLGSFVDEEFMELETIFGVVEEAALACENCPFYKCKNYDEEAPKKLKAMENSISSLKAFRNNKISLLETKERLDKNYVSMKGCTKEKDDDIVLGIVLEEEPEAPEEGFWPEDIDLLADDGMDDGTPWPWNEDPYADDEEDENDEDDLS